MNNSIATLRICDGQSKVSEAKNCRALQGACMFVHSRWATMCCNLQVYPDSSGSKAGLEAINFIVAIGITGFNKEDGPSKG